MRFSSCVGTIACSLFTSCSPPFWLPPHLNRLRFSNECQTDMSCRNSSVREKVIWIYRPLFEDWISEAIFNNRDAPPSLTSSPSTMAIPQSIPQSFIALWPALLTILSIGWPPINRLKSPNNNNGKQSTTTSIPNGRNSPFSLRSAVSGPDRAHVSHSIFFTAMSWTTRVIKQFY